MATKVIGENVTFRIEIEDAPKGILLVLDRRCDFAIVPWEDAFTLAQVMESIIQDVRGGFVPTSHFVTVQEQAQIKLNHHKGLVAILVEWTDRVRFTSLDAFYLISQALRKTAQDAKLELKGIHFKYDRQGMIFKLINSKDNTIQHIR